MDSEKAWISLKKIYGVENSIRRCKTIKGFGCQIDEHSENEKQLFEHHHVGDTVLELTKKKCIDVNLLQSFFFCRVYISKGFHVLFKVSFMFQFIPYFC